MRRQPSAIPVPAALKWVGIVTGSWAILVVLSATLVYRSGHPEFSFFATYLSDIGDTTGWPQILFNSGTLIAAPLRYLVLVLLALRLLELGAGRGFLWSVLVVGLIASAGTVVMTAVPFSVFPTVHKAGIPLYFLGVVVLQTSIGVRQWTLAAVPRLLPFLSLLMVLVYLVFAVLVTLVERGAVGRNTPVVWEWLAFASSVVWVFAQSILLGRTDRATVG